MQRTIYTILFSITALLLVACGASQQTTKSDIIVTIQPLKYLVEQITGDDFRVDVLVPANASPETFEPTPKQVIAVSQAKLIFSTGLIDFETSLTERMPNKENIVNLSRDIALMEGSCSHNHAAVHHCDDEHCDHTHHANSHGIDPHIWTSPKELKVMAKNAYEAIIAEWPDSIKYTDAYNTLVLALNELDAECAALCEASATKAFVIYHPALTYFARAYGLEQIAVEKDGKEPSAKHLTTIIDESKAKGVKCLLYQVQYPRSAVEIIAKDMGVECYEIDPLKENAVDNILAITHTITGNNAE